MSRSVMKKEVPNPIACSIARASPQPIMSPLSAGPNNSRIPTPTRQSAAASHVCGASWILMGFLSTSASRVGQTTTVTAPKNATVAGETVTNANDWVVYPRAVKQPHKMAVGPIVGLICNKNGNNAKLANTIRAHVAADGGRDSFIMAPRGKLVPYKMEAKANNRRGPRYELRTLSTKDDDSSSIASDERLVSSSKSGKTQTPRAHTNPGGTSS
mmetsp:Transcript_5585/g.8087  ORF Transcript_5585/g.8087 Transcript_5585/m.8087 type:complete len:214 (+) Transcript_5585:473-1114(+)